MQGSSAVRKSGVLPEIFGTKDVTAGRSFGDRDRKKIQKRIGEIKRSGR